MKKLGFFSWVLIVTLAGSLTAVAFESKKGSESKKDDSARSSSESRKENDKKGESGGKKASKKATRHVSGYTKEREAAALTFVRAHHAELAELLDQLKAANLPEYQRAIRDLFQSSEHLAQIEERNPQRYDVELQNWKINSRIQVLVARLTMQPTQALEGELRQLLAEKVEAREQWLMFDYQKMQTKLAEAGVRLDEFRQDRPKLVDEWLEEILEQARDPGSVTVGK